MSAQAEVLVAEDRIIHVRNHERIKRVLCGPLTTEANSMWPKGHIYVDRAQLENLDIAGRLCEKCVPHMASIRNPATA